MAGKTSRWLFHQITYKHYEYTPESGIRPADADDESVERFLGRFGGGLGFAGKSVLDIGSGLGALCFRAAEDGAAEVVGVDLDVEIATQRLHERFPGHADRVRFVKTAGRLEELAGQQFDVVVSKDSMEHFADPEGFVDQIKGLVAPGGELAIGFSPLWKSPKGGHINFMTPVPWAHILFPEETIMAERRRFRPHETAQSFAEIKGGLNKMTLRRFRRIMAASGLRPVYFETNVSSNPGVRAMKAIARIRPLREYFTQSVYSIWRRPPAADRP